MASMINSSPSDVMRMTISRRLAAWSGPMTSHRSGVLAEVIDEHGMLDRVEDVFVSDAVAAGRRVNLHTSILYYEKTHWDSCGVAAHSVSATECEQKIRPSLTCPQLQSGMLLPILTGRSISIVGNKKMRLLMLVEPLLASWLPVWTER